MGHIVDEHVCAITIFKGTRGTMNPYDIEALTHECKKLTKDDVYIETGSYLGLSSLVVASFSDARVYAHDVWETDWTMLKGSPPPKVSDYFLRFYEMVKSNNLCNRIIPIRGDSKYTIGIHDDASVALAFIDGDHSFDGCYGDLKMVLPKMKPGSVILVHDCYTDESETTLAVKKFVEENNLPGFARLMNSCGMIRIEIV